MRPAAKRAFWIGLFVVWFDFTWDNIPLLPNLLGYVLLAWALGQFAAYGQTFRWASVWAVGLAGAEATRLLAGDLADLSSVSQLDPWLRLAARLPAIPLLLSAALYWCVSAGVIDWLVRVGDGRLAGRLRLVRGASLLLSLANAASALLQPAEPRITLDLSTAKVGLGLLILAALLIGVSEVVIWAMALRRLPALLHPVFPLPLAVPRAVKLVGGGLLALALIVLASIPLGRAPQAPRLLSLRGGEGVSGIGSRAAWSPDGARLAVGGTRMPARVYDAASGKLLFETADRTRYDVHDLAWSPNGARLLSAGTGVFIDDGLTGAQIACIAACPEPSLWVDGAAWSPDGQTLALAADDLWFFDMRSMTATLRIEDADIRMAAFSPDGSLLATANEQRWVRVRNGDGRVRNEFSIAEGTQIRDIAWNPDGTLLAVAADFNVVEIWDVRRAERVRAFVITSEFERRLGMRPHRHTRDMAASVAWSPDGHFLAAGGSDASAGVWELASGEQVLSLNGQTDLIGDIAFSPDGRRIATASHDETVWVWDSSAIYE